MEDDDKPFACSFSGCKMRFTNEDHLTVHKKKHDMVLNFDKGEKANVFVADQTPTPTRFIRNCEEVGLFQDLQNVNPFEETFRKAVEASKSGTGPLHEVETLTVNAGADDSLHTPHVFPHIIEDSTSSSGSTFKTATTPVISSTSVIIGGAGKKTGLSSDDSTSPTERRELDRLLRPTSTTGDESCPTDVMSGSVLEERRVISSAANKRVVRQEADTSQHRAVVTHGSTREAVTGSADKQVIGASSISTEPASPGGNTVQLLLRMPDGKLLQLSALPLEQVSTNSGVQASQVEANQPEPAHDAAMVLTTPSSLSVPENNKKTTVTKTASGKQPAGISLAKLKLKQALTNINRSSAVSQESPQPKVPIPKITISGPKKSVHTSNPETESSAGSMSSSNNEEDPVEKRQKFLARNRAAAMRCREKRKTWIYELEKRADDMQRINQQLQSEVASLRAEVASLKTLLLAHKDCPVTQAMAQGNVTLPVGARTSSPQIVVNMPIAPRPQPLANQSTPQSLIVVNGAPGLKRISNEPPLIPAKKLLTVNSGSPIIRQALLLPSTQGSVQVINNSAIKTVASAKISSSLPPANISVPAIQPGVLVTNPIITIPVTVPSNPLPLSAVIQNSSFQQTIVPMLPVNDADKRIGCEVTTHVIKVNPNATHKSPGSQTKDPLGSGDDSDIEIISDIKSEES